MPVNEKPSSGSWFHCLHATSQALQPMQTVVSVKKPVAISGIPSSSASPAVALACFSRAGALLSIVLRRHMGEVARVRIFGGDLGWRSRAVAAPRGDVRRERLRLLYRHVWVGDEPEELVRGVAGDDAFAAPVIGESDLMNLTSSEPQRFDAIRYEHARLDLRPRGRDGRPASVFKVALPCQLRAHFAEHLGLELAQPPN